MKAARSRKPTESTKAANPPTQQAGFQNSPIAMIIAGGRADAILAINEAACDLLVLKREQAGELTLAKLFELPDRERIESARMELKHGENRSASVRIAGCVLHGIGQTVDLTVRGYGQEKLVIALQSASSRLELEQQLRQAAKMESVGMLAGGVAHDFNNLLTIISGYTQMLQSSPHLTTERDKIAVEQILKASERAAELTGQLLAFSRRRTVQPGVLEPAKLIDQTTLMLRRLIGEHIDLQIRQENGGGRIHADVSQIQQVVMNLVINSRDAMPDGGILMIETRNVELDPGAARTLGIKPGPHLLIAVSDTGTGMDEATHKRIFEPFFTTKVQGKGTGLGLATVSGIVRQYGGAIEILSELGHGTTFKVFFPRVDAMATEETKEVQESAGGNETVLFAEDEEGVRRMVTASLERRGYHVLVAASGREALELSRSYPGPIDLLVTDLVMPYMNGRELASTLGAERPGTPVIYISGYAGEIVASLGAGEGESRFLQKPFAPATLTFKIRELLDQNRAEHHSANQ